MTISISKEKKAFVTTKKGTRLANYNACIKYIAKYDLRAVRTPNYINYMRSN